MLGQNRAKWKLSRFLFVDLDPHVSMSWSTSPAKGTLSHPPSHLSTHLQTPSLSLYLSRTRKNPRTRESKEWREDWRRRRGRRREASAPPHGFHQPLQHNHGELKRVAPILWIFHKVVNLWFWWRLEMMEAWMEEELDFHSLGYGSSWSQSQGSLSQSQGLSFISWVLV